MDGEPMAVQQCWVLRSAVGQSQYLFRVRLESGAVEWCVAQRRTDVEDRFPGWTDIGLMGRLLEVGQ